MNKIVIVLKDGSEITSENGSDAYNVQIVVDDLVALGSVWDKLTNENLKEIQIRNVEGGASGNYKNMALCSPVFRAVDRTEDGKIHATFGLRNKTEVELLREQVTVLSETVNVHDGAIGDMGAVISAVAEAQEGVIP